MADYNPDEKLIKKPQDDEPLTEWQVEEWIKCAKDKYYFFSNYLFVSKGVPFKARDYQKRLIDAIDENKKVVGLAPRQGGKSQTLAADILWQMIFHEGQQILVGSYTNQAVLDFMERISFPYQELVWWLKPPAVVFNKFTIRFSNNSSVKGQTFSSNFGRGMTNNRIILDELGFISEELASTMMPSLQGSLTAGGIESDTKLNIISTPNGTQGPFYEVWSGAIEGSNSYVPVKVEYEELPGRGPDENGYDRFKEEVLQEPQMTQDKFDQEYRCHFISSSGTLVNSRFLESIKSTEPVKEVGDLRIFVDSLGGRKLAIACDPSEGIQEDASVFQVFDVMSFEQVAEYQNNSVNQSQLIVHLLNIVKYFDSVNVEEIFFSYESNGIGAGIGILIDRIMEDPVFERVQIINDPNNEKKGKMGMTTTNKSKLESCGIFKDLVENGKITLRSQRLINELKTFIKTGASFAAQPGNHDDLVSGCLLYVRMLDHLKNFEEHVYDTVSEVTLDDSNDEVFDIFF